MRILIVTQFYPPELGAAPNRLSSLGTYLKESGHTVTVLTSLPNYPTGEIYDGYKGRFVVEENSGGIRIIRTWLYTQKNFKFIGRLVSYISFAGLALLCALYKVERQDIVITESPPLFAGIAGLIISRFKSAKFVLNVSDLWPDSAIELGMLKNRTLVGMAQYIEQLLYRKAVLITGQTQGIVNRIRERVSNRPVALITNGIDGNAFVKSERLSTSKIREQCNLVGRFVVGYAGLHGLMQDLETVIEAARLLRAHEDVVFVLYGEGPKKKKLMRLAEEARIHNVHFYPPHPVECMPEIFASFDAMVIPLRRLAILEGAIPFKMLEAMGAAVPIVLSGEGEAEKLIRNAQCGIVVEPEKPKVLADGVLELYRSNARRALGHNGRRYVMQHYNRRNLNSKFADLLSSVCYGREVRSQQECVNS